MDLGMSLTTPATQRIIIMSFFKPIFVIVVIKFFTFLHQISETLIAWLRVTRELVKMMVVRWLGVLLTALQSVSPNECSGWAGTFTKKYQFGTILG